MAHIKTKDPFGFVGSHVIHQRSAASTAPLRPGSFSLFDVPATATAAEKAGSSEQKEEHGWITRYDARLDSYTLFIPGKGASVHSRGDVMKLIADPNFLVQNDDDDKFPAPIEDRTSRYVDVPMTKTMSGAAGGSGSVTVNGVVKCYLPFADEYKVVYEDSTTEQVSEDAIINSMIFMLTTQRESAVAAAMEAMTVTTASDERETRRKRKRGGVIYPPPLPAPVSSSASASFSQGALTTPPATVRSVSAPVVSVTVPPPAMMPVSYSAALGMDSSPIVTPSNILELVAARAKNSSSSSSSSTPAVAPAPAPTTSTPAPVSKPAPTPTPRAPAPASTPFVKNEPVSSGNIIMLIDDEPGVDMIPFDADDDVVMLPVESSPSPAAASGATSDSWTTAASTQPPPFYLITEEPSQMVELLETRSLAYKYVRDELLNLLDRKEASAKKVAIQYDILRNPDIKHISSIKRFTEASGLVVLNHLISTYLSEHEYKPRDADLLLLLKVVAMLPIPARKHVADSKIALTIGKLAKPRSLEMYPKLPVCITHLAKWIKRRWTEHFRKQENQQKSTQRSAASSAINSNSGQRLATRTAPPGSSGASTTAGQRSSHPIDISDRLVDTQPIPRLASRPALAGVSEAAPRPTTDVMGNPIAARSSNLSLPLSSGGTAAGRKSSLKPDWMRQQENLRRTRFTSEGSQDSTAEYNHYKRVRRTGPAGSSSSAQPLASGSTSDNSTGGTSSSTNPYSYSAENEQLESAGGTRGTFGRNQKLSFGSRWSVVEFHRDAPPSSVRPSNRFYHHSQSTQRHIRPRSILRRQSKYQGNLDSIR